PSLNPAPRSTLFPYTTLFRSPQETVGRVVPEIDAAQLPDELLDIEVVPEVPQIGGALNEFDQKAAPLAFHLKNLLSDHALDVVRSEEHTSELQSLAYLVCRLL